MPQLASSRLLQSHWSRGRVVPFTIANQGFRLDIHVNQGSPNINRMLGKVDANEAEHDSPKYRSLTARLQNSLFVCLRNQRPSALSGSRGSAIDLRMSHRTSPQTGNVPFIALSSVSLHLGRRTYKRRSSVTTKQVGNTGRRNLNQLIDQISPEVKDISRI